MKPQAKLKIAHPVPTSSKDEKAMERIRASWLQWKGEGGAVWGPYDGPTHPWSQTVTDALDKGRYIVPTPEPRLSLWHRIIQWWKS